MIQIGANPPFLLPLLILSRFPFQSPFTWNPSFCAVRSRPPWPQVARELTSPSSNPPQFLPTPNSQHPRSIVHHTKTTSRFRLHRVRNTEILLRCQFFNLSDAGFLSPGDLILQATRPHKTWLHMLPDSSGSYSTCHRIWFHALLDSMGSDSVGQHLHVNISVKSKSQFKNSRAMSGSWGWLMTLRGGKHLMYATIPLSLVLINFCPPNFSVLLYLCSVLICVLSVPRLPLTFQLFLSPLSCNIKSVLFLQVIA